MTKGAKARNGCFARIFDVIRPLKRRGRFLFIEKKLRLKIGKEEILMQNEKMKTDGAGMRLNKKLPLKNRFTTKRIALMAVFVAIRRR